MTRESEPPPTNAACDSPATPSKAPPASRAASATSAALRPSADTSSEEAISSAVIMRATAAPDGCSCSGCSARAVVPSEKASVMASAGAKKACLAARTENQAHRGGAGVRGSTTTASWRSSASRMPFGAENLLLPRRGRVPRGRARCSSWSPLLYPVLYPGEAPPVVELLGVAGLPAVAIARGLDRRAVRRQLVDAHVAPAAARRPLQREVGLAPDGATGPRHVRGRADPARAHAAGRVDVGAAAAGAQHLAAVAHRVFAALAEGRLGRVLQLAQPALAVGVVPARVEPEADGVAAEGPAVAPAFACTALVTAVLRRLGTVTHPERQTFACAVRVRLLAAHLGGLDSRAVGHASDLILRPLALAVAAAVVVSALRPARLHAGLDCSRPQLIAFLRALRRGGKQYEQEQAEAHHGLQAIPLSCGSLRPCHHRASPKFGVNSGRARLNWTE
eukprot:scaffold47808_cov70-Phaeocystis_antarctica.AAC.4